MSLIYRYISSKKVLLYLLIILLATLLIKIYSLLYPIIPNRDWAFYFRPGVIRLFTGGSPYTVIPDYPPWALLLLSPLALLPLKVGSTILMMASPIIYSFIAYKLGAKLVPIIFFAFSSPVITNALNSNIDWMPALGLLMPPQIGLFFVLIKPQAGIGVAIYWLFEAWKKDHIKVIIKIFWPVTLAYLISFAVYGFWPFVAVKLALEKADQSTGYANLFPWAVPLGLGILFYAIRKKLKTLSISSSVSLF